MESSEIRSQLDERLAHIQSDLVEMIETVADRVGEVTSAMLEGDIEAADHLIAGDDEIDLLSLRVEEGCVETLIREQPVASDLRFVVAAIHMNSDVERSGDLVANIAKAVGRLQGAHPDHHVRDLVARMSSEAQTLLRRASESFVNRDAELAASIDELDDLLLAHRFQPVWLWMADWLREEGEDKKVARTRELIAQMGGAHSAGILVAINTRRVGNLLVSTARLHSEMIWGGQDLGSMMRQPGK